MKRRIPLLFVIVLIVVLWVMLYLSMDTLQSRFSVSSDVFNGLNSLFAALAFAAIIFTINLQKEELALQRQELKETRQEFVTQNHTLKKQRFETTFFNIISLHHEIIDKIYVESGSSVYKGRQAIWKFYEDFKNLYVQRIRDEGNPAITLNSAKLHVKFISESFADFYMGNERHLRHYFKNFSSLISLARHSDLVTEAERSLYYEILSSQLNSDEIALMYYYFHIGQGYFLKDTFNDLSFGAKLNPSLLADISHTYLLDPPSVIQAALGGGKEFFVIREGEKK